MISFGRASWLNRSGKHESVPPGIYSGLVQGTSIVLEASELRRAIARVNRDAWNTAGTTITLSIYKWNGTGWDYMGGGETASGTTTVKGVSQPNPAMPDYYSPALASGTFKLDVTTTTALSVAGNIEE